MKDDFAHAAIRRLLGALAMAAFLLAPAAVASELRLLMFEEDGCIWCARWNEEIGPAYPKTEEGRIAPLTRLDIHEALPEGITLDRPAHLTPTFVLVSSGTEVGRLEGYPGSEFFWFLLDELIAKAPADPADS